ncbi:MAG: glyoxylate/hydroxypyruvate reductase A [Proteobacteria bacterium]|nr:glyoxylate/hydroxypyruvate reductase A [Pseudomonadota bacterium]MDA1022075.1 glyoxylate/hydroxypyruvate reductase A [Pseudomonadota bacterium]
MALLFSSKNDDPERWREVLAQELPDLDFRIWTPGGENIGDPGNIEFALVWGPKKGALKAFPNLKAILSLGAGVDHLLGRDLPGGVPVARLVDPGLTRGMREYVIYWTIHYHRRFGEYAANAAAKTWRQFPQANTCKRRVGIMGLGMLGADAAAHLTALQLDVAGWSRSAKTIPGVTCYDGEDGLGDFLARTEILVCLLPLTPETTGIINANTLAQLPKGAAIINAARGPHVVDGDLIQALDSGHVAGATLDVFHIEPLPGDHAFWEHPKINLTPHAASLTTPETAVIPVAENIRRVLGGDAPEPLVDMDAGY